MIAPHFTAYNDNGKEVTLTYEERLVRNHMSKAVFVANAQRGSEPPAKVVVKFAYAYDRRAHDLLATVKQAPRLWHCAYEETVGMWVVVMDYVEGKMADAVLREPAHVASLRAALTTLHHGGYVFGDLRRPNVLVDGERVMLIDFDWCGKAGEARYPADILLEPGMWDDGVERGGLIEQKHDAYHFRLLTKEELYP